jgi:predicted extracellular nuclease
MKRNQSVSLLVITLAVILGWWWQRPAAAACPAPAAGRIMQVGDTLDLPPGTPVSVHGRVTQLLHGERRVSGFWLQDAGDGDVRTPDGIFISSARELSEGPVVGEPLLLSGTLDEQYGQRRITGMTQEVSCGAEMLGQLTPVSITLPERGSSAAPLEQYEGMLVTFAQELTVTQAYFLGRYGQVALSAGGRLFHPGAGDDHGADDRRNRNRLIILDDASSSENPAQVPFLEDGTLRAGYVTSNLTGVLDRGLTGSGTSESGYRLQATQPVVFGSGSNPRTEAPAAPGGNLRLASFNVENWFTTLGERGARTARELGRQQDKLVSALLPLDADIIGLIEIENDSGAALRELVAALNRELPAARHYSTLELPPQQIAAQLRGRDLIRVALIYRPAQVLPVGPALIDTAGVHDRPPLAQAFRAAGAREAAADDIFSVIVTHFKSRGSCASFDRDEGEGCWNERRTKQAQALLGFIRNEVRPASGSDALLIMGDLNSYALEAPVRILTDAGFSDLLREFVPAAERYTYVFSPGYAGYLDHLLASPALTGRVSGVSAWHINADEPAVLGYSAARFGPDLYRPTPFRSSDHDPLLLGLDW